MRNDNERMRALVRGLTRPVPPTLKAEVAASWLAAMRAGDLEAAWQATDRLELPRRTGEHEPDPSHLRWDGAPLEGRRVLVRCLHGLGDTLQFMRFVPGVAARARELHFLVQPMLLELMRGAPGLGEVSNAWTDDPPACDVEIEVMELAYALRCRSVPPPYPHLAAQLAGRPRIPTEGDASVRVALLWAASEWDSSRSVPLEALRELVRVPGAAFYSLQQGPPAHDPLVGELGIQALSARTQAIADAAKAMTQMDLVVSIDGMPAHLAATLGRPTWLMLKREADWRWMDGRTDTPWYPTMRLFRQGRDGDWGRVVADIASALRSFRPLSRSAA